MTAGNNNSNTVFVVPQATSAICDDVAYYQSCNPALIVDYSPSTVAEYPQRFVVSEELEREREQQDRQPNVTNKTKRKSKPKTPARKSGRSSATGKKPKTWCPAAATTTTTTTATPASRLPLKKRKQFPAPRPGQFDDAPEEEARAPRSSLAPPTPSSAGGATKRASPAAVSNPRDTPRAPKRHRARPSRAAIPSECCPSHRLPVSFEKKRDQKTTTNKNNYKNNYKNSYNNKYNNKYNNNNNNNNGGQLCYQHFPLKPLVPTKRRSASENLLGEFQIMRIQQRLLLLREQQHFRQTGIMHTTAVQRNLRAKLLADAQGRYFDPFDQRL